MSIVNSKRLPEEIYVRRRAAAAVVLLIVIGLLVWGAVSLFGSDDSSLEGAADSTGLKSLESERTSVSPESSATAEGSGAPESTASPEPSAAPSRGGDCSLEELGIQAEADAATYGPDRFPVFSMVVENPTGMPCVVNLDEHPLRFEVYSLVSNERIWSDVDCNDAVVVGREEFSSGEPRVFTAEWSRTSSAPGACDGRQPVPPGGYYLHAVIGNHASPPVTFNVS